MLRRIAAAGVWLLAASACAATGWTAGAPVLLPGQPGSFDETAVKDPSIVRHKGKWHVFYTARGRGRYSLGYVAARRLEQFQSAPRVELARLRGAREPYAAAPQVFWFRPQKKWYLIYQTTDSNYQPVYSTTATLDQPDSWTAPAPLVQKTDVAKWIDFWVVCDRASAYLFFTREQKQVMVMTTRLSAFPGGFGEMRPAFAPVHEAVHVYRARGSTPRYLMLFERNREGRRSFGLAIGASLAGPWWNLTDEFATGPQVRFPSGVAPWTSQISHGELIRSGADERLEVNEGDLRFLIQGLRDDQQAADYPSLPWRLGVIRRGAPPSAKRETFRQ